MGDWIIYVIDALIVVTVFLSWAWWMRSKYARAIAPSKKAPQGMLMAEFWPETGMRYKTLLPIEVNGIEIKAPRGHQCPRYFFNKASTNMTKYPEAPFLNLKFIQAELPIVSWPENNPEPINPYQEKPVVTSAMIDSMRDEDFAAFSMLASKELEEAERELQKALANSMPKRHMYILLIVAAGAAAAAAFIGWQVMQGFESVMRMWGM